MSSSKAANAQIQKIRDILSTVEELNDVIKKVNEASMNFTKKITNTTNERERDENLMFLKELFNAAISIASSFVFTSSDWEGVVGGLSTILMGKGTDYIFEDFPLDNTDITSGMSWLESIEILKPIDVYPGYKGPEFRTSDHINLGFIDAVASLGVGAFLPGASIITKLIRGILGYGAGRAIDILASANDKAVNSNLAKTGESAWNTVREKCIKMSEEAFNGGYPEIDIAAIKTDKEMQDALTYFLQTDSDLYERFKNYKFLIPEDLAKSQEKMPEVFTPKYIEEQLSWRNPKISKKFVDDVNGMLNDLIEVLWNDVNGMLNDLIEMKKGLPTITWAATGGFTDGITIAGEAGTEAVISFDPAYHAQNIGYWKKAGELLGTYNTEQALINAYNHENSVAYNNLSNSTGKLLGLGDFTLGGISSNGSVIYDFGGIKFAPDIHVTGNSGGKEEIVKVIKESEHEFQDMFDEWFENWKKRKGAERYANSYNRVY